MRTTLDKIWYKFYNSNHRKLIQTLYQPPAYGAVQTSMSVHTPPEIRTGPG